MLAHGAPFIDVKLVKPIFDLGHVLVIASI